jgi:membrane associated rhomboid family serine protease
MAGFSRDYHFTKSLTFYIIIITVIVWIIQLLAYPLIDDAFSLDPATMSAGHAYQFVTYMFLHATYVASSTGAATLYPGHIAINMLIFAIFGFPLEQALGRRKFISLYIISGIGSAVFYLFVTDAFIGASSAGLIGASGAIFGVVAAYAFMFPKRWIYVLGLIPLPAALMLVFLLVEESFLGLLSLEPGVANFGHVGGIITGLALMTIWRFAEKREKSFGEKGFEYVWE